MPLRSRGCQAVGCLLLLARRAAGFAPATGLLGRRFAEGAARRLPQAANAAPERYYSEQALDHFAPDPSRRTWAQRYFEDASAWGGPGAPIFLSLGGEGPAYGPPYGLVQQLATKRGAGLITLEHRFYGASQPLPDLSARSLRYLSTDQALADAAQFIDWYAAQHGARNSSWVVFGGSYAGVLAAWLRLKYPSSVVGAVASSAPVLAQLDFYSYNLAITKAIARLGGDDCASLLERALTQWAQMLHEASTRVPAARLVNSCGLPESDDDVRTLMGSVMLVVQALVQYNEQSQPDIVAFCSAGLTAVATGKSLPEALSAMLYILRFTWYYPQGPTCLESSYAGFLEPLRDESLTTATPTNRQWYWQLCTQFGQQTCEPGAAGCAEGLELQPSLFRGLARDDDLAFGLRLCGELYNLSATPPARWTGRQVGWTNIAHGGAERFRASNVIFVNGQVDPYATVSLLPAELGAEQLRLGVLSLVTANGSHCADMAARSAADSPEMAAIKGAVMRAVAGWLDKAATASNGSAARASPRALRTEGKGEAAGGAAVLV